MLTVYIMTCIVSVGMMIAISFLFLSICKDVFLLDVLMHVFIQQALPDDRILFQCL